MNLEIFVIESFLTEMLDFVRPAINMNTLQLNTWTTPTETYDRLPCFSKIVTKFAFATKKKYR